MDTSTPKDDDDWGSWTSPAVIARMEAEKADAEKDDDDDDYDYDDDDDDDDDDGDGDSGTEIIKSYDVNELETDVLAVANQVLELKDAVELVDQMLIASGLKAGKLSGTKVLTLIRSLNGLAAEYTFDETAFAPQIASLKSLTRMLLYINQAQNHSGFIATNIKAIMYADTRADFEDLDDKYVIGTEERAVLEVRQATEEAKAEVLDW
jgi:hypothetical protein